jgi:hypothetical protein
LQSRQDIENLPAAQVDVEQRTVKVSPMSVLENTIDARQRADYDAP